MSNLLTINHDATLTLLQDYFISALEDEFLNENLMVKILTMLGDYSYENLYPYSQAMAMVAYNVKSIRVISAVFNLFGHWGNKASLNMLLKFNAPKEPWLLIKYNSLIKSLKERCSRKNRVKTPWFIRPLLDADAISELGIIIMVVRVGVQDDLSNIDDSCFCFSNDKVKNRRNDIALLDINEIK